MREMSRNRQTIINLTGSIIAFGTNLIISFFLSPYIVRTLGAEANGFIALANNFNTFASLVTIALNSMAGRFITIKIHQNDIAAAKVYYSTVVFCNIFLIILFSIPMAFCVIFLDKLLHIPVELIADVKLLFCFLFTSFLISTGISAWNVSTFSTNKLFLSSFRSIQSNVLRVLMIVLLFSLFKPSVYFVGLTTLVCTLFIAGYSAYYKKTLLPFLGYSRKDFSFKAVRELLGSGIWNTINQTGIVLLNGLDLLITNLMISSKDMGVLSVAKTIPIVILNFTGTMVNIFAPSLTIDYAKGNITEVKNGLKKGMKLTGVLSTIPLALLIIFGDSFYTLWVPSQDAKALHVLSVLNCISLVFISGTQCLYNVFTVVNKLKVNSLLVLLTGILNTFIVFVLLKTTNLGIYAVASVSSLLILVRNLFYTIPYAAKYLGFKWNTFIPEVGYSVLSVVLICLFGYGLKSFFSTNSWGTLGVAAILTSIAGLIINGFVVLTKSERAIIIKTIIRKLKYDEHS